FLKSFLFVIYYYVFDVPPISPVRWWQKRPGGGGLPVEDRVNQIKQQLSAHNYKLTPQREATVRVLLENEEKHLSAEDVYLLVKGKSPEIGLATVYRTLELLSRSEERRVGKECKVRRAA